MEAKKYLYFSSSSNNKNTTKDRVKQLEQHKLWTENHNTATKLFVNKNLDEKYVCMNRSIKVTNVIKTLSTIGVPILFSRCLCRIPCNQGKNDNQKDHKLNAHN